MPQSDEEQNIKITKLEVIMEQLKNGFDEIKTEFKDFGNKNDEAHKCLTDKIDRFIESADGKYASKSVEKAMWWLIAAIGGSLIGVLFRYVSLG